MLALSQDSKEHAITKLSLFSCQVEERLSKYMDSFDIVLVNDQSMEIPNAIVRQVLEGKNPEQDAGDDDEKS